VVIEYRRIKEKVALRQVLKGSRERDTFSISLREREREKALLFCVSLTSQALCTFMRTVKYESFLYRSLAEVVAVV